MCPYSNSMIVQVKKELVLMSQQVVDYSFMLCLKCCLYLIPLSSVSYSEGLCRRPHVCQFFFLFVYFDHVDLSTENLHYSASTTHATREQTSRSVTGMTTQPVVLQLSVSVIQAGSCL